MQNNATSVEKLRTLFEARSIALVGASESSSWCRAFIANLQAVGFSGSLYMVNPTKDQVFGHKSHSSLQALPEAVDVAFVAVAPSRVEQVIDDAGERGVSSLIVLAAGYAELGAEGRELEASMVRRATEKGITILGPNGLGYINFRASVAPCGFAMGRESGGAGPISVVLHSGRLAGAVLDHDHAYSSGVGFVVSMGNEAQVTSADVIDYLLEDPGTKVIAMFLEGIRSPERFKEQARRALELGKPLVVLKVGRSEAGQRAVAAHTGALAGDDAVTDAAFRQLGIIRVDSLDELMNVAGAAARDLIPKGPRLGVVTASGGVCEVVVDLADEFGLEVPAWSPSTEERLREIIPSYASAQNPLDVTGAGQSTSLDSRHPLEDALEIVSEDDGLDAIFYVGRVIPLEDPKSQDRIDLVRDMVADVGQIIRNSKSPVISASYTAYTPGPFGRKLVKDADWFIVPGIDAAMRAIGRMAAWSVRRAKVSEQDAGVIREAAPVALPSQQRLSEWNARTVLEGAGVPFVPSELVTSVDELEGLSLEYPLVAKVCASGIAHKSDIGGVVLNIQDGEGLRSEVERLLALGNQHDPEGMQGVIISPMRSGGVELLAGVSTDPVFGKVLTIAVGGVLVELLKDSAHRLLPVSRAEVLEMIDELRGAQLFQGFRGSAPVDKGAVADAVHALAQAAEALDGAAEIEVNPFLIQADRVEALDSLIIPHENENKETGNE